MGLATIFSRACVGVDAPLVRVEVHISGGMPAFNMVGLPETTVKEAKDRVRCALINSRFEFPHNRITVSLAPADLPKEGGRFDLPIALGILAASEQLPDSQLSQHEFVGELALNGALRAVKGVLPAAIAANKHERVLVVPQSNAHHAALVGGEHHRCAASLLDVCQSLFGQQALPVASSVAAPHTAIKGPTRDLQDIIGQAHGKRALEIAAAGEHNLLFLGPPGTGKTMLASRLSDLLPPLTQEQAIETAAVTSLVSHQVSSSNWRNRPFRSPHHSASMAALVGGGTNPRPGEISLAHNGLLFLDELPEFDRRALDSLREPLESGEIIISRANGKTRFPARFQLVGALNPSPSGYYSDQSRQHTNVILRYLSRLSGPLLDRFDMSVEIPLLPKGVLAEGGERGESTEIVKQRVNKAREVMIDRAGVINAQLAGRQLEKVCQLTPSDARFLEDALHQLGLSIRAYHRILKVARTIADLDEQSAISRHHISEALGYRAMDRLLNRLNSAYEG